MVDGGYEEGYASTSCFWGDAPGSYVVKLVDMLPPIIGAAVLDAGCGEGKNAQYLDKKGALVTAIDCSAKALANARERWPSERITWIEGDISAIELGQDRYDLVVAYGFLHCLQNQREVDRVTHALKDATKAGGHQVICTFNSRSQDLRAHPGFRPCLLPHQHFLELFGDWEIIASSDEDLTESHPHNKIVHTHSMTRLIARKPLR